MNYPRFLNPLGWLSLWLCCACASVAPPPAQGPPLADLDPVPPSKGAEARDESTSEKPERAVVEQSIGRRDEASEERTEDAMPLTPEQVVDAVQDEVSGKDAWETYQVDQRFDCVGPLNVLDSPHSFRSGESNVTIEGWRTTVERRGDVSRPLRIGVLSAVKDKYPATLMNITEFMNWFQRENVDLVVLNGDVAYEGEDLMRSLEHVARTPLPIWVIPGNVDPVSAFNLALRKLSARYPNLMNGSFVRLLQVGPVALLSLPGYYDGEFIPSGRGCQYYGDDLEALDVLASRSDGMPVLVSHGPPKGTHQSDIDFAFDAGNVGDARMNKAMARSKIPVGIFGHILEAGGRITTGAGGKAVSPGKWSRSLWVNAGSTSSVEQDIQDGAPHKGMAAIVEIDPVKRRARAFFEVRRP